MKYHTVPIEIMTYEYIFIEDIFTDPMLGAGKSRGSKTDMVPCSPKAYYRVRYADNRQVTVV